MSFIYWLSKFSQEAMFVELLLIGLLGVGYFGYLLTKKRRYGAAKNNIPDNVVRAFLIELIASAEGFKSQLFGETGGKGMTPEIAAAVQAKLGTMLSGNASIAQFAGMNPADPQVAAAIVAAGGDPVAIAAAVAAATGGAAAAAPAGDNSQLKAQLAAAVQKQDELAKTVAQLTADLTKKAGAAPAGDAGKQVADLNEKITKLEAKLSEYEVIEDDLANLKKYQQENKQLKAQLEGKGGAVAAAPEAATVAVAAAAPAPEAPAPEMPAPVAAAPAEASPLAAAEATVSDSAAAESFEGLVDKVEESLAATPTGASATDPIAEQQAKTTAPVADAPAQLDAALAAADKPLEPKPEKSDADLLNEFERMLSS